MQIVPSASPGQIVLRVDHRFALGNPVLMIVSSPILTGRASTSVAGCAVQYVMAPIVERLF